MKTTKKVLSLVLCAIMLLSVVSIFGGCSEKITKDNPGAIIPLYMDSVTSFDPAVAYADEASSKLLSLVYQGLFTVSNSGKLEKALCKSYSYKDGKLTIKLNSTKWSDGTSVDAEDFIYAWTRILDPEVHCEAAPLLFGIKNAIAVKNGDLTESSLGVNAARSDTIEIELEEWADVDTLLYNMASTALYPIRQDVAKKIKDDNWATLAAVLVTNGPFYVKKIDFYTGETDPVIVLERNVYYYLDTEKNESLDKFVVPYRLNIFVTNGIDELDSFVRKIFSDMKLSDYNLVSNKVKELEASMSEEELAGYTNAQLLLLAEEKIMEDIKSDYALDYIESIKTKLADGSTGYYTMYTNADETLLFDGSVPLETLKTSEEVVFTDMMVTGSFYFNLNNSLFESADVRTALSSVLDRTYIAETLVGSAKPAGGLISDKVFNVGRKTSFRKTAGDLIATTISDSDISAASAVISAAGLSGAKFDITVNTNAAQIAIGEYAIEQWKKIGLDPSLKIVGYESYDYLQPTKKKTETGEWIVVMEPLYTGLTRDLYRDTYSSGNFDVIFYDVNMLSTDAFNALAVFSPKYSGGAYDFSETADVFEPIKHITGFSNSDYDALIDAALKEADKEIRAEKLHEAEKLLLEEMPVCPLFYYQNSYVISDELSGVSTDYFGYVSFKRTKYEGYVQAVEITTTVAAPEEETPEE